MAVLEIDGAIGAALLVKSDARDACSCFHFRTVSQGVGEQRDVCGALRAGNAPGSAHAQPHALRLAVVVARRNC
ncbi:unannotated protein [freshwater metagenome]|uniref:Unannotated protein n=1 Tax=freshwater metagenome TaxID=449393 RepID=A0A6J7PK23_9ZZZZ